MAGPDPTELINVAAWIPRSAVNGPGERFVLWVQGCRLRCPGCVNIDMWPEHSRHLLTADGLWQMVADAPEIEGVTLTGGEPFLQAAQLLPFARRVKAAGLSLMAFTGFEPEEIRDPTAKALVQEMDILVTGRFLKSMETHELAWRGSRNQDVHFLSTRYSRTNMPEARELEVHLSDGDVAVTGIAGMPQLHGLGLE